LAGTVAIGMLAAIASLCCSLKVVLRWKAKKSFRNGSSRIVLRRIRKSPRATAHKSNNIEGMTPVPVRYTGMGLTRSFGPSLVEQSLSRGYVMKAESNNRRRTLNEQTLMPLLRASEVAELLGVSLKTLHKLVREKKLACVQVTSRDRRFTLEQVQDYIRSQSTSVRVDKRDPRPVSSYPKKGGAKSIGVSGTGLAKEIRSLCRS
jgi:excisionase family DNA binding protein